MMFCMSDIIILMQSYIIQARFTTIGVTESLPAGIDRPVTLPGESQIQFNAMKTSPQMIRLIMQWEGFRAKAYRCPAGVLTVGYGHTGPDVTATTRLTMDEAETMLLSDLGKIEASVTAMARSAGRDLSQHQFDALVSLAFNIGPARLRRSMLWRKIRNNAPVEEVAREFRRWVHGNGKVLPGLVSRREREAMIYSGGGYA